jgi:hypothetical protein
MPGGMKVGGGIGGLIILLLVLWLRGPQGALEFLDQNGAAGGGAPAVQATKPQEEELVDFVRVVLGSTEDVWDEQFRRMGKQYRQPVLELFTGRVDSACGRAGASTGPFYCPADQKLYIDLSFYDELKNRFHAPGDFAQAYVIAHEVGHHVQNLLGLTDYVHSQKDKVSVEEYNRLSVRLELQADFFAGVWAHHADRAQQILERGDIEEGLTAASAIGDDRLQMQSRGYVTPDSFTHGTSEQRVRWFRKGLQSGDVEQGNTFEATSL